MNVQRIREAAEQLRQVADNYPDQVGGVLHLHVGALSRLPVDGNPVATLKHVSRRRIGSIDFGLSGIGVINGVGSEHMFFRFFGRGCPLGQIGHRCKEERPQGLYHDYIPARSRGGR